MPGYEIAYVGLALDDPAAAARVFEDAFELPGVMLQAGSASVPVYRVGRTALALFDMQDDFLEPPVRKGVHHLALATADPVPAAARHGLPVSERARPVGLAGRRQAPIDPAATGGVRLRFCEPLPLPEPVDGPVERIDHLGVASANNAAALDLFVRNLGGTLESQQTDVEVSIAVESFTSDKYGVVYRERPAALAGGLRVSFVTVGDCELEFLQDLDPSVGTEAPAHDRPGNTKGDQGAIARYVGRYGPGLHHLALKVRDIDGLLGRLHAAGHRLIDRVGRPGSRRARIGFVHPTALGGLLLHFVERDELT